MNLFARCNYEVMNSERIAARMFVVLGGLVWVVLWVGSAYIYPSAVGLERYVPSLIVVALALLAYLIGWFFENLAAVVLFLGAAATIVWGIAMQWEPGVWGIMAVFLITPEIIGGLLFLMAAQMQKVCELDEAK